MAKFYIKTLGCRTNQYESKAISEKLNSMGLNETNRIKDADYIILNTCAVTSEAGRKSRQMVRKYKNDNPHCTICVIGCYSELFPESLEKLDADIILGSANKLNICDKIFSHMNHREFKRTEIFDKNVFDDYHICKSDKIRNYIKIEDGCNNKCTYCIISTARGPARSKPVESIFNEAILLADSGTKEIILTGIEISDYDYSLTEVCKYISSINEIERIRFGSLTPKILTDEFIEYCSENKKIMPHFHISLQSGSSNTLKAMRRQYNAQQAKERLIKAKNSIENLKLSCDLIVGFPGETDDDFMETLDFLKETEFFHIHLFPYSKRPGTPAATFENQISSDIKNERIDQINAQQKEISDRLLKNELRDRKSIPVLFEEYKDGYMQGHSDDFIEVKVKTDEPMELKLFDIKPVSFENKQIIGELIK